MPLPRQRLRFPATLPAALWASPPTEWRSRDPAPVGRFETAVARTLGIPHAIAVDAGKQALALLLKGMAVPPGALIGLPAFTYYGVPAALRDLGYRLFFIDVEAETFNITAGGARSAIAEHPEMRVVIATHLFGVPAEIEEIATVCAHAGVALIEDCAHAFASKVGDRMLGSFGTGAFFSLEVSKQLNAMGGGIAATADESVARAMRASFPSESGQELRPLLRDLARQAVFSTVTSPAGFGTVTWRVERLLSSLGRDIEDRQVDPAAHVLRGPPARLHPFKAELAIRQLPQVRAQNERRSRLAGLLRTLLDARVATQRFPQAPPPLLCFTLLPQRREALAAELLRQGVDSKRDYMSDCHRLYDGPGSSEVARELAARALHLPFDPGMADDDVVWMARVVNDAWARVES
jgi:dTDP-4-amino-4,6-dideoxygalactose transaminase